MNKPIPFGKYYLLERVNVGGMAEVFKAKAFGVEGFERLLAVKRILPNIAEDEEFITMFIDEAKIAVQLQHANIAQIFDLGKVDDSYFIALEFVHGRDLRAIFDHLRKLGVFMPISQVCYIMMQVCEGLDYAHNKRDSQGRELNLVHRDVSPQNVLIGYEGEVKLVDFGIAKAAGKASKTQAGILKGKFGYMSPEQVRGLPVDRRSDIFSCGIVLYELLTNERLFVGESDFSTLEKVRNVEILPPTSFNRQIPAELERIVLKALAKDVEDRYQNAIDLHDDLQAFLYSLGELYSRKDLAAWMKKSFAHELEEENAKLEQYRHFHEPTPAPVVSGKASHRANKGLGKTAKNAGVQRGGAAAPPVSEDADLSWDEEELETQIFDRAAPTEVDGATIEPEEEEALTSSDLYVGGDSQAHDLGEGDDKTVLGPPPDELLGELAGPGGRSVITPATPAPRILSRSPSSPGYANGAHADGGPPPGLSAYRGGAAANGLGGAPGGDLMPSLGGGAPAPMSAYSPGPASGGGMSRQTMPYGASPFAGQAPTSALPGYQGPPPGPEAYRGPTAPAPAAPLPSRPTLESYAQRKTGGGKGKLIVALLLIAGIGAGGYWYVKRPGKVQLVVTPPDAEIVIDGTPVKGPAPVTLERSPGLYTVQVRRDGYDEKSQNVDVQAGGFQTVDIQLKPSALTGFELTSDPPGALVWLDGAPFLAGDAGRQVRTNFKARSVTPGRHVLEIKGDPRFADWRYEFYQEPAKMLKVHAALVPRDAAGTAPKEPGKDSETEPSKEAGKPTAPEPAKVAATPPAPAAKAPEPKPLPAAVTTAPKPAAVTPAPKPVEPVAKPAATKPEPASEEPAAKAAAPKPAPAPAPKKVAAAAPKPAAEPAASEESGGECTITLGSKPWSEVWIDGKNTGKITPLVDFKVPCGKRKVTFKNPELKIEKQESISVRAGEKFKKVFQLVDTEE